jgi:hypothetical protein
MPRLLLVLLCALRSALRSQSDLALENLALRQQLAAFACATRRPRISGADRWFWITLRRLWSRWLDVLVFVKPNTGPQPCRPRFLAKHKLDEGTVTAIPWEEARKRIMSNDDWIGKRIRTTRAATYPSMWQDDPGRPYGL